MTESTTNRLDSIGRVFAIVAQAIVILEAIKRSKLSCQEFAECDRLERL